MTNRLSIHRCDCGFGTVLERVYCPRCRGFLHPSETDARGVILSWTVLHTVAESFEAPIGLAMVGLDSGINTMARFRTDEIPDIGEKVIVQTREDGLRWISRGS